MQSDECFLILKVIKLFKKFHLPFTLISLSIKKSFWMHQKLCDWTWAVSNFLWNIQSGKLDILVKYVVRKLGKQALKPFPMKTNFSREIWNVNIFVTLSS